MDNARSQITSLSRILGLEEIKQYRNKSVDWSLLIDTIVKEESKEM
jgi:hypothetical protein